MVKKSMPNFFICPISLGLMKDPVTLSTGQTYDRRSIEKWFQEGHNTCPSTMQVLSSMEIAPNHTLQRLIQQWCSTNNCGAEVAVPSLVPFTKQADPQLVKQILQGIKKGNESYTHLKKLRSLAKDLGHGDQNRIVLMKAGVIPVLAQFVFCPENLGKDLTACEEALSILTLLPLQNMRNLHIGTKQLTSISWVLNRGSLDGRVNSALLLASLAQVDSEIKASVGATVGVFEGLVQLLKEDLYPRAMDAGLKTVLAILSDGPDRYTTVRAVQAGLVVAVAELLPESEKRNKLMYPLIRLLELLCSTPEGQKAVSAHALVVPMLVRIISLRDNSTTHQAVSCLWTLCQSSPKKCVDEAAGQAGLLTQLFHVVQADKSRIHSDTRQKATQLLQQLRYRLSHCDPSL